MDTVVGHRTVQRMNSTLLHRSLRAAGLPLYRFVMRPSVRASKWFRTVQEVVAPSPQEAILSDAMSYVAGSHLPGDYLEFGTFRGASMAAAFHAARRHPLGEMRFYGFDSFEGMPDPSGKEAAMAGDYHRKGAFLSTLDECSGFLADNGVDMARVDLTPGWFDDSLTAERWEQLGIGPAAVITADCSMYGATLTALSWARPAVQDGTLVVFVDWFSFRGSPDLGTQRAFHEWLAADPSLTATQFQRFGWHGNSFVIHKATAGP